MRPITSFKSTDFPVPLPPISATTSPPFTEKLTPSWMTSDPKRVTIEFTSKTMSIQTPKR